MKIELLNFFNLEELYAFEINNRDYFEQFMSSLGDDYYLQENFLKTFNDMLKKQEKNHAIYYLIFDNDSNIIGTISLTDIDHNNHSTRLECKIAENSTGVGIATYSLKTIIDIIDKDLIREIHCKITHFNIGFQKVLEKNGFQLIYIDSDEFNTKNEKSKNLHYHLKLNWNKKTER